MTFIQQCLLGMATLVNVISFRYSYSAMKGCRKAHFITSLRGNRLSASEILKRVVENEMIVDGYR